MTWRRRALALTVVVAAVGNCVGATAAPLHGARRPAAGVGGRGAASTAGPGPVGATAPSGPPLLSGTGGVSAGGAEEEAPRVPQGEEDPLVSNGLDSPLCSGALGEGEMSASSRSHCETSGFVAAPAPTGDYGIDVHIDTGVLGLSSGGLLSAVQDVLVTPLWMGLVWAVHALIVMLEWSFTIDLLDGAAAGGLGRGLHQMQAAFTYPWLTIAFAVASVLALYNGLVRRRVGETLGQALLMAAMMAGGLWVIADPSGTVGALGEWSNQAGLGTLGVAARGTPESPGRTLGESMDAVFAAAIEAPWCYLEFGNVGWCRDPRRIDPRLRAAGLRIAAGELRLAGCRGSAPACAARGAPAKALEHSAQLLREARSNGSVFLALPANGPARNSINEQGSLLRTICASAEATNCHGADAAEAEFRTNDGTWPRMGGLLLIGGGLLGMLLLLGFIALRLLTAALFSLLFLLLAPGMVLAPAFGESGRALFRRWLAQLLGAVFAKLLFAFLLGVVLAVEAVLSELTPLGWWTQWLLMSTFWWGGFARRHQTLAVTSGGPSGSRQERRPLARRVKEVLDPPRKALGAGRWASRRIFGQAPPVERRRRRERLRQQQARAGLDAQARRTLDHERRQAGALLGSAPHLQTRLTARRAQLARVRAEHGRAVAGGDRRRAHELADRGARIETDVARRQAELADARRASREAEREMRPGGRTGAHERQAERARFLDEQANLPAAGRPRGPGVASRRDYPALAGLVGLTHAEYERLAPGERRAARLEIDRELALRRALGSAGRGAVEEPGSAARRREQRTAERDLDTAIWRRMHEQGQRMPGSRRERHPAERVGPAGQGPAGRGSEGRGPAPAESGVMRDAREVAARRKRQLGIGRD